MIKFIGRSGKTGELFLGVGLSYINLDKLKDGRPIDIDIAAMLRDYGRDGQFANVIIFAGETEATIAKDMAVLVTPETRIVDKTIETPLVDKTSGDVTITFKLWDTTKPSRSGPVRVGHMQRTMHQPFTLDALKLLLSNIEDAINDAKGGKLQLRAGIGIEDASEQKE